MKRANLDPKFIYDIEHIVHLSTRVSAKRGDFIYRGFGCYACQCVHPELTCNHCVLCFSSLSLFK